MSDDNFRHPLQLVKPHISKKDTRLRTTIPAEERLISTLRFLVTGRSLQDLQSLGEIIPETCNTIIRVLRDDYMKETAAPASHYTMGNGTISSRHPSTPCAITAASPPPIPHAMERESDPNENNNMLSSGCQSSHLKRKRHSSEHKSDEDQDIENLPTNEEKKYKDESRVEASCSFEREGERRQPFSELKMVKDSNIEALVSDQERLSLSDEVETTSPLGSCDVARLSDLSPEPLSVSSLGEQSPSCLLTPGTSSVRTLSNYQYEDLRLDRFNPLPPLSWADLPSLWQLMCDKDEDSLKSRDPDVFSQHPSLQPRMRAVLLDWIIEVCDVYKLHRETYYLTMDYIDRYLSSQSDVPKQQLQLIGITCLQLASKNEEIYPPKMAEYAYVTDGACSEREIIGKELVICEALDWRLNPVTPIYWLKVFLQIKYQNQARHDLGFYFPQFSPGLYQRVAHLLDLCTLDVGSLRFSYSVLAAAALYLACNTQLAVQVSGLAEEDLLPCVDWMSSFWEVLKEEVPEYTKKCSRLPPGITKAALIEDSFNLQKHEISLQLLDNALQEAAKRATSCLLTPPSSSKKRTPLASDLTFT